MLSRVMVGMVSSSVIFSFHSSPSASPQAARFSPPFQQASLRRASLASRRQQESRAARKLGGQEHERCSLVWDGKKNGRRDSLVLLKIFSRDTTYSFLASVTAVVMAGSEASA